jgi:DNA-binding transcriptional LysR family regulator
MDRLNAMKVFTVVAEERSLSAAGRRLGMSAPAVTRAIAALEDHLGSKLLFRTTRIVRLTEPGARFLSDCKRILSEIDEAEASASGAYAEPRGQLSVTAPVLFGRLFVAPLLFDFISRHPRITARTLFVDRVVDLIEEGQDIAIRIAHLPDSSLTAARCGSVRHVLCASPKYLAAYGRPKTPSDLLNRDTIELSFSGPQQQWSFDVNGKRRYLRPSPRLVVNTADAAIAAAVSGRGIARVLSYQVSEELKSGALEVVLGEN